MKTTLDFLKFLYGPYGEDSELTVEIRTFKPEWAREEGKSRFGPRGWRSISDLETVALSSLKVAKDFDVYFGVLPRTKGGGGSEHLRKACCLWIDFDAGEGTREQTLAFAKERIEALSIPNPNGVVSSGGGYHGYWVLSEPADLTTQEKRESFRKVLVRFAKAIGGSLESAHACPRATDCARILRLPGTFNLKRQDNPRPVEIVRLKAGDEKPLLWWTANLPPEPLPPPRTFVYRGRVTGFEAPWLTEQMEAWLTEPAPNGGKHDALVDTATRMRKNDQSEADTLRILTKKAANSGVNVNSRHQQDHIEEIVAWVFAHVDVDVDRPIFHRGVRIGSGAGK